VRFSHVQRRQILYTFNNSGTLIYGDRMAIPALFALAIAVNEVLPHIELWVSGYLHSGKKIWALIT
jgi:hypothetical protein